MPAADLLARTASSMKQTNRFTVFESVTSDTIDELPQPLALPLTGPGRRRMGCLGSVRISSDPLARRLIPTASFPTRPPTGVAVPWGTGPAAAAEEEVTDEQSPHGPRRVAVPASGSAADRGRPGEQGKHRAGGDAEQK